jgi:hypothetical protein
MGAYSDTECHRLTAMMKMFLRLCNKLPSLLVRLQVSSHHLLLHQQRHFSTLTGLCTSPRPHWLYLPTQLSSGSTSFAKHTVPHTFAFRAGPAPALGSPEPVSPQHTTCLPAAAQLNTVTHTSSPFYCRELPSSYDVTTPRTSPRISSPRSCLEVAQGSSSPERTHGPRRERYST